MDEIGRGTSTFDGMALAFAILPPSGREEPRLTLFATHYFELDPPVAPIFGTGQRASRCSRA